jgi:hypothetical protein
MIVSHHIPEAVLEFIARCLFNTLLLLVVVLPMFNIPAHGLTTLGIVVILDLANRVFTRVWGI